MIRDRARALLFRFVKFGAVGWMGMGVQLTALTLLKGFFGLHYLAATVLAVESAILHNFLWHERWTWSDRGLAGRGGGLARLFRFNATTGLVSLVGNVVFMRLFVGELGLHYLLGNLASIASCAAVSFLVSDRLVWHGRAVLSLTRRGSENGPGRSPIRARTRRRRLADL